MTHAVRRHLFAGEAEPRPWVIPCCADLDNLLAVGDDAAEARTELAADERPILLYVGKFTGSYMEQEMVEFFVAHASRSQACCWWC